MTKIIQTINVVQTYNPSYVSESDKPEHARYVFIVKKTKNILDVWVDGTLTAARVQELIDSGVNVQIS